jgi:hypothetical protein
MQIKHIILSGLLATLFVSCTTDIAIDLNTVAPELVVDGAISTDTIVHTIYLKKTSNYFSNEAANVVSGATVTLNDGISTVTLQEDVSVKGAYHTAATYFGVVGRTYTLTIDNVDVNGDGEKERYTASCPLNAVPAIDAIAVVKGQLFYHDVWPVKLWMQDPPNVSNYYLIREYRNNVCVSDSIDEWGITSDEFFDGVYLNNETIMYFSSHKQDEMLVNGDKISLEVCGITKDYLNFIQEVKDEYRGRNPLFGGQPANIRTNIRQVLPTNATGSPRGYFAAYATSWAKTVYRTQ